VSEVQQPYDQVQRGANGLATAGMICGIVSVTTFWVPFAYIVSGLVVGIVAVVLSHKGRSAAARGAGAGSQALAGLICGYAGIVLSVANGVAGAIIFSS
jgi:hypothetical protein